MNTTRALSIAVIAVATLAATFADSAAQGQPDFSGSWLLNRQASSLPPPVSAVKSGVLRIEHREPSFSFHRTYVIGGVPREASFTLLTDGRETTETGAKGLTTISTLRWANDALVLAMRIQGPG